MSFRSSIAVRKDERRGAFCDRIKMSGTTEGEVVDKKGYKTSILWKWFGYLKTDEAQDKTDCKLCRRSVPAHLGNTTNLFQHRKTYHPSDYTESMKMCATTSFARRPTAAVSSASRAIPEQQSIVSSFAAVVPYDKQKMFSEAINVIKCSMAFFRLQQ